MMIVAPHHDDETIGAGGLIAKYISYGGDACVVSIFSGESGIPDLDKEKAQELRNRELHDAAQVLGIKVLKNLKIPDRSSISSADISKGLIPLIREYVPDIVLIPHLLERDPEHQIVASAAIEASWLSASNIFPEYGNPSKIIKVIMGYEVWTPIQLPQYFEDITDFMDTKQKAIAAYKSQIQQFDWAKITKALGTYRAGLAGLGNYAEAYTIYRLSTSLITGERIRKLD